MLSFPEKEPLASETAIPTTLKVARRAEYTAIESPTVAFRSRAVLSLITTSVSPKVEEMTDPLEEWKSPRVREALENVPISVARDHCSPDHQTENDYRHTGFSTDKIAERHSESKPISKHHTKRDQQKHDYDVDLKADRRAADNTTETGEPNEYCSQPRDKWREREHFP